MTKKINDKDDYIKALEEELCASIERERKYSEENLSFLAFMTNKVKGTKLYKNVISDPDSKMGKVARMPRSIYRIIKNPEVRSSLMQKKTVNNENAGKVINGHFLDPWMITLENRKKITRDALKTGKKLALYFVEKPDSSTFRYRCYNTFESTLDSKKWQSVYFFKNEIDVVENILPKSSIIVLGRQSGQEKNINKIIELARKHKIKVGLDIDDLVFDMKYIDIMLDTINERANKSYWLAYFASVQSMAKLVDFFITTNDFLAGKLKDSFDKPCKVIRNSMNSEQVGASRVYVERKRNSRNDFTIGYFSGSPTHEKDFATAEPEIIKFLQKHDEAKINVVGYMKFSKEAKKLIEKNRIRFLPFTDFRKLQRLMSEVDVNIAPLVINDFTNCKSELKFFEAAAVETTTIASPTYTFKKAIKDGENGILAQPGEWYSKLEYLYKHPEENKRIAKIARDYALKHYYGKEFLKEVESVYEYFAK